jgi:hypothetical protein
MGFKVGDTLRINGESWICEILAIRQERMFGDYDKGDTLEILARPSISIPSEKWGTRLIYIYPERSAVFLPSDVRITGKNKIQLDSVECTHG